MGGSQLAREESDYTTVLNRLYEARRCQSCIAIFWQYVSVLSQLIL